jgi:hypothetical protein
MTAMPIGARKLESPEIPSATGNMPAPMAIEVMMMGRERLRQASMMASNRDKPRSSAMIA